MIRTLLLAGAVGGAAACSQFPAFSQQYLQRLAGQVDALQVVVMDFDASALEAGLGRETALQQMTGTPFLTARQSDMRSTFARHARLTDNLEQLRTATPLQRLAMPHRLADPATLQATWADFRPALPLTTAGAVSAGAGAVAGWSAIAALLSICAAPFRRLRRREKPVPMVRQEPVLQASEGRQWQDA